MAACSWVWTLLDHNCLYWMAAGRGAMEYNAFNPVLSIEVSVSYQAVVFMLVFFYLILNLRCSLRSIFVLTFCFHKSVLPLRLDFGNVAMIFLFVFCFMSRSPSLFKWRITVEHHFSYFHDENMIHVIRKGKGRPSQGCFNYPQHSGSYEH